MTQFGTARPQHATSVSNASSFVYFSHGVSRNSLNDRSCRNGGVRKLELTKILAVAAAIFITRDGCHNDGKGLAHRFPSCYRSRSRQRDVSCRSEHTNKTLDPRRESPYPGSRSASAAGMNLHEMERMKRIKIEEIAGRLSIGRLAVYALLERGEIPAIRLGRRWIVTRHAYEAWERTCGTALRPTTNVAHAVQSSYDDV